MRVFIVPGNPPARYFYDRWQEEWNQRHPGDTIFVSEYPELHLRQNSHEFLEAVARFHENAFTKFHGEKREDVVVVGHSLGANFALNILNRHPDAVEKCFLIYPFVRAPLRSGKRLLRAISYARRWDAFERLVLAIKPALEKMSPDVKHITDREARISFILSYHEHFTIAKDRSHVSVGADSRKKTHLIYTPQDRWCSPSLVRQLTEQIPTHSVPLSHDFIRSKVERTKMTDVVSELCRSP